MSPQHLPAYLPEQLLELAFKHGATAAEVYVSDSRSQPVYFEANRLKQLENLSSEGIALRLWKNNQPGVAVAYGDVEAQILVEKALAISDLNESEEIYLTSQFNHQAQNFSPKTDSELIISQISQAQLISLGEEAIAQWQNTGTRAVYHYGFKQEIPLNYEFFSDAQTYLPKSLERELPILIIHGNNDEVVPCSLSQNFVSTGKDGLPRSQVTLEIVESDHSLGNVVDLIWQKTATFLELDLKVLD